MKTTSFGNLREQLLSTIKTRFVVNDTLHIRISQSQSGEQGHYSPLQIYNSFDVVTGH